MLTKASHLLHQLLQLGVHGFLLHGSLRSHQSLPVLQLLAHVLLGLLQLGHNHLQLSQPGLQVRLLRLHGVLTGLQPGNAILKLLHVGFPLP